VAALAENTRKMCLLYRKITKYRHYPMENENNIVELTELAENDVFVVKESVTLDYGLAGFFTLLGLLTIGTSGFPVGIFSLIAAAYFLYKGVVNREALRVDCNGIYQNRKLVTTWHNFAEAFATQVRIDGEIAAVFVLIIRYYKEGITGSFRMTIPLTDTQNKSEDEILAAIRRFYQLSLDNITPLQQPLQIGNNSE
jgi:hypothetical protein